MRIMAVERESGLGRIQAMAKFAGGARRAGDSPRPVAMNQYGELWTALARRLVPAGLLGTTGWILLAGASGGFAALPRLLLGFVCLVAGVAVIAPALAALAAEPVGNLFWPGERFDRPQPIHSIGEALRKRGRYQDAFNYVMRLAEQYPQDLKCHVALMEIAARDLKNRALAERMYRQGLAALASEEDRRGLEAMHAALGPVRRTPAADPPLRLDDASQGRNGRGDGDGGQED